MTADPTPTPLWDALGLAGSPAAVVAIVGGGGKTSLLFALGREAVLRGERAVLSGTTRFTRPADAPPLVVLEADGAAEVQSALDRRGVVVVTSGFEPQERLRALTADEVTTLAVLPGLGLLALEADGSRMRPFKAPGEHEPVIPAEATHVVAVVGVDAINASLDEEHVHRPERVRALLDAPADRCTIEAITRVLLHPEGGRRGVAGRAFAIVVNKADLDPAGAQALARSLHEAGAPCVLVTSMLGGRASVWAVLGGSERRAQRLT